MFKITKAVKVQHNSRIALIQITATSPTQGVRHMTYPVGGPLRSWRDLKATLLGGGTTKNPEGELGLWLDALNSPYGTITESDL